MKLFDEVFEKTLERSPLATKVMTSIEIIAKGVTNLTRSVSMLARAIQLHSAQIDDLQDFRDQVIVALQSGSIDTQFPDALKTKPVDKPN